jgi:hypothetical protein
MRAVFLLGLIALATAATAANIPFTNCGASNDQATVQSVSATPWPPVQGQTISVTVSATSLEQITGGNYDMKIYFMGIQVNDQTGTLASLGAKLPIAPGPFTVSYSQAVPTLPIHGQVQIVWSATDQSGAPLVCVQITTTISETVVPEVSLKLRDNIPFTNCGNSGDKASLSSVTATPWPPQQGQELTLNVNGVSTEQITSGNYEVKVYFLGIQVEDKTGTLASLGIKLPIAQGPFTITKSQSIPQIPIHGEVKLVITATDQNSAELLCVEIDTNI